jgi:hypothetical protein
MWTAAKASVIACGCVLAMLPWGVGTASAEPLEADWVSRDVEFSYLGLTSFYSCDGLERKLKRLLELAGARPGATTVSAYCSDPFGGPSRLSGARLKFAVLVPRQEGAAIAGAVEATAATPSSLTPAPVVAAWRRVHIDGAKSQSIAAGDCELVEQFDRQVLPSTTVRERRGRFNCAPGAVSLGAIDLGFEALLPAVVVQPTGNP